MACYCDDTFPDRCDDCEHREALIKLKHRKDINTRILTELSLPDGHPDRIFTNAEIADKTILCDKKGMNQELLREIRMSMFQCR